MSVSADDFFGAAPTSGPLVSTAELETWAQRPPGSLTNDPFAIAVLGGVSILVRDAGSADWTSATMPARAKLIAIIAAKNYFLNPTGLKSETTGPLSETRIDDVVHNMELSDTQKAELAELAGEVVAGASGGLWVQPTTSGRMSRPDDVFVTDQSGSDWMIPWARIGDHLYPRLD